MKKIIIISTLFLATMNMNAQKDSLLRHPLDYSTKGIYFSSAYFITGMTFVPEDSTENLHFLGGLNNSIQIEFKRNVAINFWYANTTKFNYHNTWFNNQIKIIGSNINFPLYKNYKHNGFYMMGGVSWEQITGYYTSSTNALAQAEYREYSPYIVSTWALETGVGYEYKLKYFQFYSLIKMEGSIEYGRDTYSCDFMIGARFKMPKVFRNPKQRYPYY